MARIDDLIKRLNDEKLSFDEKKKIVAELEQRTSKLKAVQQKNFQAANAQFNKVLKELEQTEAEFNAGLDHVTAVDSDEDEIDALMATVEQESLDPQVAAIDRAGSKGRHRSDSSDSNSSYDSERKGERRPTPRAVVPAPVPVPQQAGPTVVTPLIAKEKPKGFFAKVAGFFSGIKAGVKAFFSNLFGGKKESIEPAVEKLVAQANVLHQQKTQIIQQSKQTRQQVREHTRPSNPQAANSFTKASRALSIPAARQSVASNQESKPSITKQNTDPRVDAINKKAADAIKAVNDSTLSPSLAASKVRLITISQARYIASAKQHPNHASITMKAAEKQIKSITQEALANSKPSHQSNSTSKRTPRR